MLEITSKPAMARAAQTLAQSYELVQHSSTTYIPAHWQTEALGPCAPEDRIWLPLNRNDKRRLANREHRILFTNDSELTNFDLMLRQFSHDDESKITRLLVKTEDGLRTLTEAGKLVEPDGTFLPNFIRPVLNNDAADKEEVFNVIKGWLNSEEEAHSLLYHLATSLAPAWSAVKYILLIGDGRNGKSVLLSMLSDLFGGENISHVTRQQIAERLPVCTELNNKLLNIIYDGEMVYIKDSSMEKTLIAGEPGYVRLLYENGNTRVQTHALFLEALNREPKTRDKSSALQKRLSRFWFPNVYALDQEFEDHMRSEKMLGAFLALLLDHFVLVSERAVKLRQTSSAEALQVEQQLLNSPVLQFVQHLVRTDPTFIQKLEENSHTMDSMVDSFMAWRVQEGFSEYSTADAQGMFRENWETERRSARENGKYVKRYWLIKPKAEVQALLDQMKGDDDGELAELALVES